MGFSPRDPTNELVALLANQAPARPTPGLLGGQAALGALFPRSARSPYTAPSPGLGTLLAGASTAVVPAQPGPNPRTYLGYTVDRGRGSVKVHEIGPNGKWRANLDVPPVALRTLPWLPRGSNAGNLGNLFRVYDWKRDDGGLCLRGLKLLRDRSVGR